MACDVFHSTFDLSNWLPLKSDSTGYAVISFCPAITSIPDSAIRFPRFYVGSGQLDRLPRHLARFCVENEYLVDSSVVSRGPIDKTMLQQCTSMRP